MTVELAIGMTALIAVLALLVAALGAVRVHADICQAVREGARAAAVGDSAADAVVRSLPRARSVSVDESGEWVTVSARADTAIGLPVGCTATTLLEPGAK